MLGWIFDAKKCYFDQVKKRIYHIHTDQKFLHDSRRFDDSRFENKIIFLTKDRSFKPQTNDDIIYIENKKKNLPRLLSLLKDSHIVVLYDLCATKKRIINLLPSNIKIIWRFFGYEYYSTKPNLIFSKKTIHSIFQNNDQGIVKYFKKLSDYIKFWYEIFNNKLTLSVVGRIDYILLFSHEEYIFLKNHWKVPKYLQMNLTYNLTDEALVKDKENNIILGNSKNAANNHLDIIDIIRSNNINYSFTMFFSYGREGNYTTTIREKIKSIKNFTVIEEFLSKSEFESIYLNSSSLVINSYRQMALGNIIMAIKYGLKIYLNDKNIIKSWLENNGILVYSVYDFQNDLINNNLKLSQEQMKNNITNFMKLSASYTKKDFNDLVYNI